MHLPRRGYECLSVLSCLQINIANPTTGAQKKIEIEDDSKL